MLDIDGLVIPFLPFSHVAHRLGISSLSRLRFGESFAVPLSAFGGVAWYIGDPILGRHRLYLLSRLSLEVHFYYRLVLGPFLLRSFLSFRYIVIYLELVVAH